MLNNFLYSVNAILPIILLVVFGFVLGRTKRVSEEFCSVADRLVFHGALPVMLFREVAECRVSLDESGELILYLVIAVTSLFLVTTAVTVLLVRDNPKRGAVIQGICRSNFAILGVPLAVNMFGDVGGSTIALTTPFVILMFNAYSVVVLSIFAEGGGKLTRKTVLGILRSIVTNPLIIGVVLGAVCMFTEFTLPTAVDKTLSYIAALTTPLSLISLGASFRTESLKGRVGYAIAASLCKTVVAPALGVTVAALLGFRGPTLGVVLICFGAPTAVSSYVMAKKMHSDHELAAQILLLSTCFCAVTIFVGIFILKTLALI